MRQTSFFPNLSRREFLAVSSAAASAAWLFGCDDSSGTQHGNNITPDADAGPDADADASDIVDADTDADVPVNPLPRPATTVRETIQGRIEATEQFEDLRSLFGLTKKGPGEPHIERDDLGAAAASSGASVRLSSLAYFAHLTDIHIVDEESPARSIHSPIAQASAWRSQEQWSTHVLAAAMATINRFAEVRPHDFVVFSGDLTDNKHFIELDWFLKIVEGQTVDPDTGANDDPRAAGLHDPHDPFVSEGLHPSIKWYCVQGNHDLLVLGNFDVMDFWVADPTSDKATLWISDAVIPTCYAEPVCQNGFCYSDTPDRCHVPFNDDAYTTRDLVPDTRRRFIDRMEWISMVMSASRNGPAGHGFTNDNLASGKSYWVDENPIPGIPLALVGLDTSSAGGVAASANGYMSQEQLNWLRDTLDALAAAQKLIVVISHHCSYDLGSSTDAFRSILNGCPNVVLHITGHHHTHQVMPRPVPAGMDPWHGYWEVQNCGLLDWPQQIRFWEIVDRGDGTGIIYSTIVDIDMPPGSTVEAARFYALVEVQEGRAQQSDNGPGAPQDRNVALRVAWPPEMIPVLAQLPQRDVETLHFYSSK